MGSVGFRVAAGGLLDLRSMELQQPLGATCHEDQLGSGAGMPGPDAGGRCIPDDREREFDIEPRQDQAKGGEMSEQ